MSMDTLKDLSKALNATAYKNMMVRQEPDIETATWSETEEEVNKGWVWFDGTEVSEGLKFVGKKFGIRQSNKIRVIDDCSCCGLNWTVGLHEKFQLQSIDILASMIAEAFKAFPGLDWSPALNVSSGAAVDVAAKQLHISLPRSISSWLQKERIARKGARGSVGLVCETVSLLFFCFTAGLHL